MMSTETCWRIQKRCMLEIAKYFQKKNSKYKILNHSYIGPIFSPYYKNILPSGLWVDIFYC